MNRMPRRCLVLALGNDLLGDDGIGLTAARLLREEFQETVDIVETYGADLALMELLQGYDRALLLDAIFTGLAPPGTILEFRREDFQEATGPTDHYVGLPEVLRQAESLGIEFPPELRILAMEVESPFEFQAGLGPSTQEAMSGYVNRARLVLQAWLA